MTIRSGQRLSRNSQPKPASKGMDVVMMNDFEQRHRTSAKSRSHSPFGHIGSPTTPLNFEQLFQLNSELSHHDHTMLQAQLLNTMRTTPTPSGMAPKPKQQPQQPSFAMLDQLRQAYNRGEQEQTDWNARSLTHHQESATEPSTIALLQQKFAQLERHKAEMQKPQQQVQIYPSQWPIANSMPPPPPPVSSSASYNESRFVSAPSNFYSFQQQISTSSEVSDQFFSAKQEMPWRPTQDAPPQMVYVPQQQQQQQQFQQHRAPEFAVAAQSGGSFSGFQLNAPPPAAAAAAAVPDMAMLGVSSRCDKTGGHSVEINSVPDHYPDSEMSLDNFSGRIMPQAQPSAPTSSQIAFISNFHMLPQSSKSAFTTFTRSSSNLNPNPTPTPNPIPEAVVTKSLLFNDTYRRSQELPDSLHDDVDTELHL